MPTASDEFEPPEELLPSVVSACVAPALKQLEAEIGGRLAGSLRVWVGTSGTQSRYVLASDYAEVLEFEGRLRFRKTGAPKRTLFSCQIRVADAPSGYSGFVVRVALANGSAQTTSHTVLHGVQEWMKW